MRGSSDRRRVSRGAAPAPSGGGEARDEAPIPLSVRPDVGPGTRPRWVAWAVAPVVLVALGGGLAVDRLVDVRMGSSGYEPYDEPDVAPDAPDETPPTDPEDEPGALADPQESEPATVDTEALTAKVLDWKMSGEGWQVWESGQVYGVFADPTLYPCEHAACWAVVVHAPDGCPGGVELLATIDKDDGTTTGYQFPPGIAVPAGQDTTLPLYLDDASAVGSTLTVSQATCQ